MINQRTQRRPRHTLPPIPDDILVLSAAPFDYCETARTRLAEARAKLEFAEAHHSRVTQQVRQFACVELRCPMDTNPANDEPLAAHWEDENATTKIVVHPVVDPDTNKSTPGCTIVLNGDHLTTRRHPLAPYQEQGWNVLANPNAPIPPGVVVNDHIARAAAAMDRALALLDLACDPTRRPNRDQLVMIKERLFGVSAALVTSPPKGTHPHSVQAYAPSHDGPMVAIDPELRSGKPTNLLTDAQAKAWSAGLRPSLAVSHKVAGPNGIASLPDSPLITFHVPSVIQDPDTNTLDMLRVMANLPTMTEDDQ